MRPTAALHLRTLYELDRDGRAVRTLEPDGTRPPALIVVTSADERVWAVRSDVEPGLADELSRLAASSSDPDAFLRLVPGKIEGGPAFAFSDDIPELGDVIEVTDPEPLQRYYPGTIKDLEARAPYFAVLDGGDAVALCYCARRSDEAAEAGLDVEEAFRRRGYGAAVTAAWARAMRASGRMPLYSTAWTNLASRGVARTLGLVMYASNWNLLD